MRPLTDKLPKPLLVVRDKPLIVWHLQKLVDAGFSEVVINIAHLGQKIIDALGDGTEFGIQITYSDERDSGALESAGGIKKALHLLGDETFFLVNGDVFCDYEFDASFDLKEKLAHLILVPNPEHNPKGDFGLKNTLVLNEDSQKYTFSGIGYYNPLLFKSIDFGASALAPLLRKEIDRENISGEIYHGEWHDIGTPQRLENINTRFNK
ncbi:MAG: nucleotidyltransferase family protein [Sulfurimonas sp.]|nr:nucleotidyltransferase family protein [Sulfurimonas sp.]